MSTERNASRVAGVSGDNRVDTKIEHRVDGRVPDATVARLATYLRVLGSLGDRAITTVSSEELAAAAGVNSAKLRKDLSFLGSYGIRGVGYDVATLTEEIARTLGLTVHRSVALIGVGNLGPGARRLRRLRHPRVPHRRAASTPTRPASAPRSAA